MTKKKISHDFDPLYDSLRSHLAVSRRDYAWRIGQLKALLRMIQENNQALSQAMWADLHKPAFECAVTEQGLVIAEIEHALKYLAQWMRPRSVATPLYNQPGHCEVHHDPFGLVLIIGAWNYPVQLLLAPLVGALAGGNAVILKPSELAVQTAEVLAKLVPEYLDKNLIAVVQGGAEETSQLLDKNFDFIFFTGSSPVGKIVMGKAAQNLTPVVLELGGKSPAIVLADADIAVTARRIAWGKFMNAGQTCVAPDSILAVPAVKERLVLEIKKNIRQFYGEDPRYSPDYCRILNTKNFDRLMAFLKDAKVLHGGANNREELFIEPTLLESKFDDEIMQYEIFGPLLPILEISDVEQAVQWVNSHPKPLALYLFTEHSPTQSYVLERTSSGGACINDVVMQMPVPQLPFGGVGASGMGHYHGHYSFETFTHAKGVLRKGTWLDLPLRYAPYSLRKSKWLRWLF